MISVVIESWRARFMIRLRLLISSSALSVALFIARWRNACSLAPPVEQRGVDAGLDVARQQRVEDRRRVGLELEVAAGPVARTGLAVAAGDRLGVERHQRTQHDLLPTGGDEPRVDQLDAVDLAVDEQLDDVLADRLGVRVRRAAR